MAKENNMNFLDLYKKIQAIDEGTSVEECGGMMPPMGAPKQSDSVTMNVSMNGSGAGGIKDLMNILKNIESDAGHHGDHDHSEPIFGDEGAYEEDFQNATTEPNEVTLDIDAVLPTGDDLHSKGDEAEKVNGGGNPFNVDESLVSQLTNLYNEVKSR